VKKIFSFEVIALIVVTALALVGLLNNSYFVIHDDQHIARLYLLDQAIKQGDLYPRWVSGLGFNFGYPLFNFYPPLIYYVAEFFHLIGLDLLWSLKMMIVTGSLISSIGMYLLGKRFFDKRVGLLAATLHTFFFYRLVTIFVRGAWAEFFAMSILPFVFLGFDSLFKSDKVELPILFSLSLGLLVLAHPLIAFPTFFYLGLFFVYYFLCSKNRLIFIKNVVIGTTSGLGISAFFWLPSFVERQYTLVNTILTHELANYKIHFIYPFQFWFSPWGYGGSIAGPNDGITFQLGKVHIFLLLFSFIASISYLLFKNQKKSKPSIIFYFLVFLLLFSLFMSVTYSQFVWDTISYLWFLQFPWRFLTFSGIFISLSAGACLYYIDRIFKLNSWLKTIVLNILLVVLLVITVSKYSPYAKPYAPKTYNEKYATSFEEISWRVSNTSFEFSPLGIKTKKTILGTTTIGLDRKDLTKQNYIIINAPTSSAKTIIITDQFSKKEFKIESKKPVVFRLNTFNFPGWHAKLNGKEIKIDDKNDYKLITVSIPQGENMLSFAFSNTWIRTVGNTISFLFLLIFASYFYYDKKRN
jgi:4-amino-4-deoxy-L-arabinose transferase-like glycosyltransferase